MGVLIGVANGAAIEITGDTVVGIAGRIGGVAGSGVRQGSYVD